MTEPATVRTEGLQQRKSRLRRQQILDVAAENFADKGFYATSLADIAEQAGITPAGILHHFKSKELLLTELLRLRDARDIEEVTAAAGVRPHGASFLHHLIATAYVNERQPVTTRLYAVLSAESLTVGHPAQRWFQKRYAGLRAMIVDALDEAKSDGHVHADVDSATTAIAIIAAMDGLQIQWLLNPEAIDMGAGTRAVIEALTGIRFDPAAHVTP